MTIAEQWHQFALRYCLFAQEVAKANDADPGNGKIKEQFCVIAADRSLHRQKDAVVDGIPGIGPSAFAGNYVHDSVASAPFGTGEGTAELVEKLRYPKPA